MKWILIWFAVTTQGGITSGSAEFQSEAACRSAKDAVRDTINVIGDELHDYGRRLVRSSCVSSDTGDKAKS